MNVNINTENNITKIVIQGRIDSQTSNELQSQIIDNASGLKKVIIDLSGVSFLSSAGLRVLLMLYRQLKANDGKVVLVGLSDDLLDVMSITGFVNFFEITSSIDEAEKLL